MKETWDGSFNNSSGVRTAICAPTGTKRCHFVKELEITDYNECLRQWPEY